MMQELSIFPPDNSEMYKSPARRCDNKYIIWFIVTVLGVALFISGFKYSGRSAITKGKSFLTSYVPSELGTDSELERTTYELATEYEPGSEFGSEAGGEIGSQSSFNDLDNAAYENSATEYGTPSDVASPTSTDIQSSSQSYILLFTEGRAGSTWLSSFFWNSPDVFYVYEPFHYTPALHSHQCHDSDAHRKRCDQEILYSIFSCDFKTSALSVLGLYPSYRKSCKNCTTAQLEEECKRSTHIIPKVILLHDLNELEDLVSGNNLDIKVIHLVRDARPLIRARSSKDFGTIDGIHKHPAAGYTDEMLSEESKILCERILDASTLGDNPPDWLKGRYMRVTHEEIAVNPMKVAKEVYTFTNLPWTERTQQAIINSTIGRHMPDHDAWKKTMSEHSISIINESCRDMLDYLGYLATPIVTSNVGIEVPSSGNIGDEIEDIGSGDTEGNEVYAELTSGEDAEVGSSTTSNTDQTNEVYSSNVNVEQNTVTGDIAQNPVIGDTNLENTVTGDTNLENTVTGEAVTGETVIGEAVLENTVENTNEVAPLSISV